MTEMSDDTKAAENDSASPEKVSQEKISIDEFGRLDLRVAKVLEAEAIPGATRLLKLIVDLGSEKRQLVAGIAAAYDAVAPLVLACAVSAGLDKKNAARILRALRQG